MYMAFVIHEDDEDIVSFYIKKDNQERYIVSEYVKRGNKTQLVYFVNKYMFSKDAQIVIMDEIKYDDD